jgi:hypothetical protein
MLALVSAGRTVSAVGVCAELDRLPRPPRTTTGFPGDILNTLPGRTPQYHLPDHLRETRPGELCKVSSNGLFLVRQPDSEVRGTPVSGCLEVRHIYVVKQYWQASKC